MGLGSFWEPNLPSQCLQRLAIVLHIFVELQEDEYFYLHRFLHRRLRAGSPFCIVGFAVESKAPQTEPSGSESCDGWKWLTISLALRMLTINVKKFKRLSGFQKKSP